MESAKIRIVQYCSQKLNNLLTFLFLSFTSVPFTHERLLIIQANKQIAVE